METQSTSYHSDKQIAQRFKVSRATIWRWAKEGHFPKPIRLSPGCTRWKLSDIEEWEAEK
jgi:prophage regulatory protein|tara:strand:+ start:444 stop:623 length:180 start_codon:yes stop_codon:yes gene_type:complete